MAVFVYATSCRLDVGRELYMRQRDVYTWQRSKGKGSAASRGGSATEDGEGRADTSMRTISRMEKQRGKEHEGMALVSFETGFAGF